MNRKFPLIRDLAVIGDRRTCALVAADGSIVWYCPERFDRPSMFASLLDPEKGGVWKVRTTGGKFAARKYIEDSGVLETVLAGAGEAKKLRVTDWMPFGEDLPKGICRRFSAASSSASASFAAVPADVELTLHPAPDYARRPPLFRRDETGCIEIGSSKNPDKKFYFYASHAASISGDRIVCTIPKGENGWACLLDEPFADLSEKHLDAWLEKTLENWRRIAAHLTFHGPYEREVAESVRTLRLLTYGENGGIIAAPTMSLPEVIGGERNYDYRYVWLRDAGMIVSALIRAGSDGSEGRHYLDFICGYDEAAGDLPLMPFLTLGGEEAPEIEELDLAGYEHSRPVVFGNVANNQIQLDAYGNVLLAAELIYKRFETREHWSLIEQLADFLVANWREPDYGIWEETTKRQYTSSKVIVACGLKFVAEFAPDRRKREKWLAVVKEIREFVDRECLNSEGAYAAFAGGEAVDVSAALFPVWDYTAPDTPEMLATMKILDRDYAAGNLFRRHLVQFDSRREGAFLASTFWVAQYWIMRRDFERVRAILTEALKFSNDLGMFAEEADPETGRMLGNFPQTFVHAAFIGAVNDLREALEDEPEEIREMFASPAI